MKRGIEILDVNVLIMGCRTQQMEYDTGILNINIKLLMVTNNLNRIADERGL